MMLTLPTEMVDHIAGFTTMRGLLALASTSRFLHDVATRRLYRDILLDDFNILLFLRALWTLSPRSRFLNRCRNVICLRIVVRDPVCIAKANPYICTIIRYMPNLRSLTFLGNQLSGSMMYMFLSRSAILIRNMPCRIPTLAPIACDSSTPHTKNLQELRHLHIGGDLSLVQLALGRSVECITLARALYLKPETVAAVVNFISGTAQRYSSLRTFACSLAVEHETDVVAAVQAVQSKFDCLEELDITIISPTRSVSISRHTMYTHHF